MTKKLWGGRFKKAIDQDFFEFQKSIQYDHRLARYDIYHSLIHISALTSAGLLTKNEHEKLSLALRQILGDIDRGEYKPDPKSEDVHSDIQNKIEKKTAKLALKLHTFRSRNDQIVYDEKMYCLSQYIEIARLLTDLLEEISHKHKEFGKEFFIGYTHTQRAQVVYFGDYIMAYAQMFLRDYQRLASFEDNLKIFIGSGALAGNPLDPSYYRRGVSISGLIQKHFDDLKNPMDNVADRDFVIELLSIISIIQMHISRMAEDFILYSTKEFDYIDLPEELCTGSSLMPHKKNPDFLELCRGYTGRIYGNLVSVLTTMKGLPLTYNRDMQLDKEPLFSSVDIIKDELAILSKLIKGLGLKKENIAKALKDETLYATEIAEHLVFKGVAFRQAHEIVGKLVRYCEDSGVKIKNLTDSQLKEFNSNLCSAALAAIINPEHAVASKRSVSRKTETKHKGK